MKKIFKNPKQIIAGVVCAVALTVGTLIGVNVLFADSVTLTIENYVTDTWEVSDSEGWTCTLEGKVGDTDISSNYDRVFWSSSDSSIVTVTTGNSDSTYGYYGASATITATGAGSATIYCRYIDSDDNVLATVTRSIVVDFEVTNIPSTTVFMTDGSSTSYFTNYYTTTGESLTWTSSDTGVITAESSDTNSGLISAVGAGYATVTVSTPDGQLESMTFVVSAQMNNSSQITLDPTDTYTVWTDTNAASASNLLWYIPDDYSSKVSISGGILTGAGAGTATIYCYPNYDWKNDSIYGSYTEYQLAKAFGASRSVRVNFGISNGNITMTVGDTAELEVNASSSSVTWTTGNTGVATVNTSGVVTAVASGTTYIRATVDDATLFTGETTQYNTITVTVVDDFSLSETSHTVNADDTFELTANVTNKDATVSWTVSDESVATVTYDEDDPYTVTVTGVSAGTVTVTGIQNINGVKKTATCEVTVNTGVTTVTLYPTTLTVDVSGYYPLVLTFDPTNTTDREVVWVSSDETIATVDDSGVVTGVAGGDCVISVITTDGIKVASCAVHVRVPVTGITMSTTSVTTSMSVGTYQLSYTITPDSDGVDTSVTWYSSNESVATVDSNGLVTFVAPGTCSIYAQTVDTGTDGSLIGTCDFTIEEPVTAIALDYTDVTLSIDETFRLTTVITPSNATNQNVTWYSSNTDVATVDDTGLVTAVASGNAAILVQSDDSGVTAMCNITVYQAVESIELSYTTISVRMGTVFWLYANALPTTANDRTITWSSSDESLATVDSSGMVTTLETGDVYITATNEASGISARCTVTITEPVTGITLSDSSIEIMANDQYLLVPAITPIDASNKNVTWESSNEAVATVDDSGVVTGVAGGTCIIICTTEERGLIASCQVTVDEYVTGLTVTNDSTYLNVGTSRYLTATVTPTTASNQDLSWSSSNTSVCTVNSKGRITGISAGTAVITVATTDGSEITAYTTVQVIKPVTSITVSPSKVTVIEGNTATVTATTTPSDATIQTFTWTSSDESVATVDFDGVITGVSKGTCYVYATSDDGNEIVGKVKVTVKAAVPATSVVVSTDQLVLLPGQTRSLTVKVYPKTTTDTYSWISSDTSVVTYDTKNHCFVAKGQGNATVTCVAESGVLDTVEVIVLALNAVDITIEKYDTYTLDVFGATENITWYTRNNRICTIASDGTVTARRTGTTFVYAKVNGEVLYCKVTVVNMKDLD